MKKDKAAGGITGHDYKALRKKQLKFCCNLM